MKKIVLIFIVLILLTGCILKNDNSNVDVKIVDSGWSYIITDSGKFVSYGVKIRNFSDSIVKTPIIKILGYDNNGSNIFEYTEEISYIYSLDTIYFGKTFMVDTEISNLDISLDIDYNNYINNNDDDNNYIVASDLEIKNITKFDNDSYMEYDCTIVNNGSLNIAKPIISIIYKKDNKIVGGSYSYVTSLNASDVKDFVLYTANYPEYDSFDINVLIGNM